MKSLQPDGLLELLLESEKPADVVQTGAACLAEMLDGFVWVSSRQALERKAAGRREVIALEKSKYNRSGHLIEFSVTSLSAFDDSLHAWRRANPGLTVRRPESVQAIVCASSFLDMSSEHFAVLTHPERRIAQLERLAAHLHETALPWFASSADPKQLARAVPNALLTLWGFAQDLIEFLVSRGDHGEARALMERVQVLNPAQHQALATGQDMARQGDRPRWHTPEALGWCSSVLGLV
ncbi:hypothetical protein [Actinacidiphila soli]|uniref:hypothetical protein n=1 Tax=Actinacidiphila soli TaxID=2487275 RepID=UPI000FCAA879|nr:hypothetical protein [Actinacidiphila soli]